MSFGIINTNFENDWPKDNRNMRENNFEIFIYT